MKFQHDLRDFKPGDRVAWNCTNPAHGVIVREMRTSSPCDWLVRWDSTGCEVSEYSCNLVKISATAREVQP